MTGPARRRVHEARRVLHHVRQSLGVPGDVRRFEAELDALSDGALEALSSFLRNVEQEARAGADRARRQPWRRP